MNSLLGAILFTALCASVVSLISVTCLAIMCAQWGHLRRTSSLVRVMVHCCAVVAFVLLWGAWAPPGTFGSAFTQYTLVAAASVWVLALMLMLRAAFLDAWEDYQESARKLTMLRAGAQ